MKRKRFWHIAAIVCFWAVIVAFFVATALMRHHNEQTRQVERMVVEVVDSAELQLVTPAKITQLINQADLNPVGKKVDSLRLLDINHTVEEYCFVGDAQTFVDYDGTLTIRLSQRKPIARVALDSGHSFYLTADAHVMPVKEGTAVNLPVVTGNFEIPFPEKFSGDMRAWARGNKKNSDKNYIFLLKLTNFVRLVESNPNTADNIVQIVASSKGNKYAQPTIELIPRRGNYTVLLGPLDQVSEKLAKWDKFVAAGVVDLNSEGTLNVAYKGQAVWKEPSKTTTNKKKKK